MCGCSNGSGGDSRVEFSDVGASLTGVGWSALAWGDYDNDGNLDLAVCGDSSASGSGDTPAAFVWRNCGDAVFADAGAGLVGVWHGSVAWGDYDGDGDLDLVIAGASAPGESTTRVYRNDSGVFDVASPIELIGVSYCSVAWGDYDNDGDLDLAVAGNVGENNSICEIFRNDRLLGFTEDVSQNMLGVTVCSIAWGDYDNDGHMDLIVAGWDDSDPAMLNRVTRIYGNDGTGGLQERSIPVLTALTECSVAWTDFNGDGWLDVGLAGYDSSWVASIQLLANDGEGGFTRVDVSIPGVSHGSIAWGDCDNNGYNDLAIAGFADSPLGYVGAVFTNQGNHIFDNANAGLIAQIGCSLGWGDFDNDGVLDLAMGGLTAEGGDCRIYRCSGPRPNTRPAPPDGLVAVSTGSGPTYDVTFSWDSSSDDESPSAALTYNLRVGTTPGANDVMPGMSLVGGSLDGKRLVAAMGNTQHNTSWTLHLLAGTYYWSVQAIDTGFLGSQWASEETTVVE